MNMHTCISNIGKTAFLMLIVTSSAYFIMNVFRNIEIRLCNELKISSSSLYSETVAFA